MKINFKDAAWPWVIYGALYGVFLRFIFGLLPSSGSYSSGRGVMSLAFLIGVPLAIGAITVYGARDKKPTITYMIFTPWATTTLMFIGTALAYMEGSICIAILSPLFLICSSIGGVIMGLILRNSEKQETHLKAVAIIPLLMIFGEGNIPLKNQEMELRQTIYVAAPPKTVWNQILTARAINPDELPLSLVHLIGVPKPVEGINIQTPEGETRFSKWERGVNFRANVIARNEYKSISWHYIFDQNSFPAGSMDDHVAIGGQYFDLNDTTFNLKALPDSGTQLEIIAHYRVTSSINFYAIPIAKALGEDFIKTILTLYKNRSENAANLDSKIVVLQ